VSQYQASYPAILDITTYLSLNKLLGIHFETPKSSGRGFMKGEGFLLAVAQIGLALVGITSVVGASVLGGTPCSLKALPRVPETLPGQR
jgi:hypothetical protein